MAPHRDIELNTLKFKEDSFANGSSFSMREPVYEERPRPGVVSKFLESFKRDPSRRITPKDDEIGVEMEEGRERVLNGNHYYDLRLANLQTANSALARKLKGRHLQMIAIGGSIGTTASFCLGSAR
jgi:amino acid transporter